MYFEKPKWEKVVDSTFRMKVPHGWLVCDTDLGAGQGGALVYVPDPGYAWQWAPEDKEEKDE